MKTSIINRKLLYREWHKKKKIYFFYCHYILLLWIIIFFRIAFMNIVNNITDYLKEIWKIENQFYFIRTFAFQYCQSHHCWEFKIDFIWTDLFLCKTCHFRYRKKATITLMVYYIAFLKDSFITVFSHITNYLDIVFELKINFIATQHCIHKFHYTVKFIYFCIRFLFSFSWLFVISCQSFGDSLINSNLYPKIFLF